MVEIETGTGTGVVRGVALSTSPVYSGDPTVICYLLCLNSFSFASAGHTWLVSVFQIKPRIQGDSSTTVMQRWQLRPPREGYYLAHMITTTPLYLYFLGEERF